jgi:hypothetical protein
MQLLCITLHHGYGELLQKKNTTQCYVVGVALDSHITSSPCCLFSSAPTQKWKVKESPKLQAGIVDHMLWSNKTVKAFAAA